MVEHEAALSNCLKRHVGAVIIGIDGEVVAKGHNQHLDGVCDCATTKTAMHAEVDALSNLPVDYIGATTIYVNHTPCDSCMLELAKYGIHNIENSNTSIRLDDPVKPAHYADVDGVPSIRFFEASSTHDEWVGYLKNTAMKYLYRLDNKDAPVTNAKKAKYFVDKLVVALDDQCTR